MVRLEARKEPLIENGFRDGNRWLGNLVKRLGGDCQKIYCRGTWSNLCFNKHCLSFDCETCWEPPFELLQLIGEAYSELKVYYAADGDDWGELLTNDAEGVFFKERFMLDTPLLYEYYETIEEVCTQVSAYIGREIPPTKQAVYAAIDTWEGENTDSTKYINLKEFRVVD